MYGPAVKTYLPERAVRHLKRAVVLPEHAAVLPERAVRHLKRAVGLPELAVMLPIVQASY